jgi:tetratricopeptide (TPR) repeat protein
MLAAAFGLGALLLYRRGSPVAALVLFALGVFSKESAAAVAGIAFLFPFLEPERRAPPGRLAIHVAAACGVVALYFWARAAVAEGPVFIPVIDNPMSLVAAPQRLATALWVQVLYVCKSVAPVALSADYSYRQIPLVMTLADPRAWAGLALAAAALWSFARRPVTRFGIAFWAIAFSPTANLLMPIGTTMGERLAYVPIIGLALLLAQGLSRIPKAGLLAAVVLSAVFAGRTFERNRVWHNADAFYPSLAQTSPGSAKAQYFLGCWKAARDDDAGALESYNRAIGIFPAYPEALNNRGNTLVKLGRIAEAEASFRDCLRFAPNHAGAAASLQALETGHIYVPQKPPI